MRRTGVVPARGDEFFSLGACVGVEIVCHDEKQHFCRDVSIRVVLLRRRAARNQKQNKPRDTNFIKHLEVEDADARIQLCAHEEIVDGVSCKAVRAIAKNGLKVHDEAIDEPGQDSYRHDGTKLIHNSIQRKDVGEMQGGNNDNGGVEAGIGRAKVRQTLEVLVWQGPPLHGHTRHVAVHEHFDDKEYPVDGPCFGGRIGALVDEIDEVVGEFGPSLVFLGQRHFAIVRRCTNPHVPHEDGESNHESEGAKRAAKLEFFRLAIVEGGCLLFLLVDGFAVGVAVDSGSEAHFVGMGMKWLRCQVEKKTKGATDYSYSSHSMIGYKYL